MTADSRLPAAAGSSVTALPADPERLVRQTLATLVETYGRGIYEDSARCEAMLRDLCPGSRREVFLVVAALKERVVSDLVLYAATTPDEVLIARNSYKLQEGLGLSEISARWAVETWLPSAQVLAALPPQPIQIPDRLPDSAPLEETERYARRPLDWYWLLLCLCAILSACAAAAAIGYNSFHHGWQSLAEWVGETAAFGLALALSGSGLTQVARRLGRRPPPQHQALDPNRTAAALLVEVLLLLLLPLVPVAGVAIWAGEWAAGLHTTGRNHDLAFHLGRVSQSLLLIVFLYYWVKLMVPVQGAIAASMVRER